jgi:hypothetical protein
MIVSWDLRRAKAFPFGRDEPDNGQRLVADASLSIRVVSYDVHEFALPPFAPSLPSRVPVIAWTNG